MSAIPATKLLPVEEHLALDEEAEEKHEYFQGEVFAVTERSITLNQIVTFSCPIKELYRKITLD